MYDFWHEFRWLAYDARCRKAGSPRLLAYMGRYRSVLYIVATSNLRGPSLGSGMGVRKRQEFFAPCRHSESSVLRVVLSPLHMFVAFDVLVDQI